jgi:hypothetical protein
VKLASDEIWGVRKACAESLVILSQNLNTNERNKTLVPAFERLADDVYNKQQQQQQQQQVLTSKINIDILVNIFVGRCSVVC